MRAVVEVDILVGTAEPHGSFGVEGASIWQVRLMVGNKNETGMGLGVGVEASSVFVFVSLFSLFGLGVGRQQAAPKANTWKGLCCFPKILYKMDRGFFKKGTVP